MAVSEEHRAALQRIKELEAKLDDYEQYSLCDCCYSLTDDPVDCDGHLQCKSCTRIAELEAENQRLRGGLESIAKNTCCDGCLEAALVAKAALEGGE